MDNYLKLMNDVLMLGHESEDRTGTGTLSLFGKRLEFDLRGGFPLVTTKKVTWDNIKSELLWFIEGSTNERRLAEIRYNQPREVLKDMRTIWTTNYENQAVSMGYTEGELGPIYGEQWYQQLDGVISGIKEEPYSRRHLVDCWNTYDLPDMALPPCHYSYQFYVRNNTLSCMVNMRSADLYLGVPYNIASYALLTHMVAQVTGLRPAHLIMNLGDTHIYKNHIDQCKLQMSRCPMQLPKLKLNPKIDNIHGFSMDSIELIDYNSYPSIKAEMAV